MLHQSYDITAFLRTNPTFCHRNDHFGGDEGPGVGPALASLELGFANETVKERCGRPREVVRMTNVPWYSFRAFGVRGVCMNLGYDQRETVEAMTIITFGTRML